MELGCVLPWVPFCIPRISVLPNRFSGFSEPKDDLAGLGHDYFALSAQVGTADFSPAICSQGNSRVRTTVRPRRHRYLLRWLVS